MGMYLYRLCKRGDCRVIRLPNGEAAALGLYEYDHKPWGTFDHRSDKAAAKAFNRVALSWRDDERPQYCTLAYRNDKTGQLEISEGQSVMKYKSDCVLDDDYSGNPRYTLGRLHIESDGSLHLREVTHGTI